MGIRTALFEEGADICDPVVLAGLASRYGLPGLAGDDAEVIADWHLGEARDVVGSPHFFAAGQDFFCPALEISCDSSGLSIDFHADSLDRFLDLVLA